MAVPERLTLQSGMTIHKPAEKLRSFCAEEYAYYDAFPDGSPYTIEPIDVTVTVAMNSFINSAGRIRQVHHGLAEACASLLTAIPADADLRTFEMDRVVELLDAACRVPFPSPVGDVDNRNCQDPHHDPGCVADPRTGGYRSSRVRSGDSARHDDWPVDLVFGVLLFIVSRTTRITPNDVLR